jgi:thiol-disulfide isomerase/thioredoxin
LNSPQRALAVILVVGVGLAAGFVSYRLQNRAPPPVPIAVSPPASEPAQPEAGGPPPLQTQSVPTTVPDLTLPDLAGKPHSLRSFGGRPLIINFWATWCEPCRREIPLLKELRQRHRPERLEIIGIALDFGTAVQEYLRRTPIDYPVLIGEQQGFAAAQQFGVQTVLPFSVFADAAGGIVAVKIGELHRDEADFILEQIRSLDAGQIGLPEAHQRIDARLRELAVERAKAQQNNG